MTQLWWAYLAGFFDGEGTIYVKGRMSPIIILGQSGERGKAVLQKLIHFLLSQGICPSESEPTLKKTSEAYTYSRKTGARYKDFWTFQVGNRPDAIKMLQGMLPYLQVKKVEAQDSLRFCKMFPALNGVGIR